MDFYEYATYFKALSDPKRVKIVSMLSDKELCACTILEEFDMSQSTLSHHMKILCEAKLLQARSEGKWTHYSIDCDTLKKINNYILKIMCTDYSTDAAEREK